jgi:hypothetical protein
MQKAILGGVLVVVLLLGEAAVTGAAAQEKAGPEKMQTASGTISKLQAAEHALFVAVSDGSTSRFVWTAETKINGTLSQGAKVTVRYTTLPDGQNLAHQISVGH